MPHRASMEFDPDSMTCVGAHREFMQLLASVIIDIVTRCVPILKLARYVQIHENMNALPL